MCNANYGANSGAKNEFHIYCSACADGYTRFMEDVDSELPGTCGSISVISFCYGPSEFSTCPQNSAGCTYLGPSNFGGSVAAQGTAPSNGVCKSYELISKSTSLGQTSHEIACVECKDGLEAGDYFTHANGRRLPGGCYNAPDAGTSDASYKTCTANGEVSASEEHEERGDELENIIIHFITLESSLTSPISRHVQFASIIAASREDG